MIPKDPIMLLSFVNMKLRDNYSSLEAMCDALDVSEEEIKNKLKEAGYTYNSSINQFK